MPAVQYADMRNHHFDFPTGTVLSAGLYIDHTRGKNAAKFLILGMQIKTETFALSRPLSFCIPAVLPIRETK